MRKSEQDFDDVGRRLLEVFVAYDKWREVWRNLPEKDRPPGTECLGKKVIPEEWYKLPQKERVRLRNLLQRDSKWKILWSDVAISLQDLAEDVASSYKENRNSQARARDDEEIVALMMANINDSVDQLAAAAYHQRFALRLRALLRGSTGFHSYLECLARNSFRSVKRFRAGGYVQVGDVWKPRVVGAGELAPSRSGGESDTEQEANEPLDLGTYAEYQAERHTAERREWRSDTTQKFMRDLIDCLSQLEEPRGLELVQMLMTGMTYRQVAEALGKSTGTIHPQAEEPMRQTRCCLIRKGWGMLEDDKRWQKVVELGPLAAQLGADNE